MAIPRQLRQHTTWFNSTDSFWSFTKTRAVREEIIGEIVEYHHVLRKFVDSGELWNPASQQRFANEVRPGGATVAWGRELKTLFNQLGSAWVNNQDKVEFTDVGWEFLQSPTPSKLVERQVQKYQIGNPQTSEKLTSSISVIPHYVLLEFLLKSHPRPITKDEFILFVMKVHKHDDIPRHIRLMEDYRGLSDRDRARFHSRLDNKIYMKFVRLYSYAANFLAFPPYLSFANSKISIADHASAERARAWYDQGNNTYIRFKSQKDWFSHYGSSDTAPNPIWAADYYRNVGESERATDAYAEAIQKGMAPPNDTLSDYRCRVYGEAAMEAWLVGNLERIEPGLTLLGSQFETSGAGRIDILARDARNNFVVVELKRDKASDAALGQLLRYLGWIRLNLSETDVVRGFVIGNDIDQHMEYAILAHDALSDLCNLRRFRDLGVRLHIRRTKNTCRAWVEDLMA